jgi:predicted Rdx family selenoprotein
MTAETWAESLRRVINDVAGRGGYFTLQDVYAHERKLASLHPANHRVREKIRQTLQVLRDVGEIDFVDNAGRYCLTRNR